MRAVLAVVLSFSAVGCLAQSIHAYKSVHADGTVSYSDRRSGGADSVTEMDIYQESAAIEQQGAQRFKELETAGKRLEEQRAGEIEARHKFQTQLADARQQVADAERGLATTQESKHNATPERIGLAREKVRLARQRLREVQSAGP